MNVLEKYSANCGVKISHPKPASSYFPLKDERYIIIDARNKYGTNSYDMFSDVLAYLEESFKEADIKVYSFCSSHKTIIGGTQPFIGLTKKQEAFLIKNSKLVLSCDNLSTYLASAFNIPSVGLYSAYPSSCTEPLWSGCHTSIDSDHCGNLPSYGMAEDPKAVNFISPEEVANTVLKKLELPCQINAETIYIGDHYPIKVVEVVPDFVAPPDFLQGNSINLRADYHFNEENIVHWLQGRVVNILVNRPINPNLLKYFKKNIVQLTVNLNDSFSEDYLQQVMNTGTTVEIFCEDTKRLAEIRFKFFDFDIEKSIFKSKKDLDESLNKFNKNTQFLSGKVLISNGQKYSCLEAKKQKKVLTGEPEIVYDTEDFWKELDHYRLFNTI
jgi:nitrogen fixation protein